MTEITGDWASENDAAMILQQNVNNAFMSLKIKSINSCKYAITENIKGKTFNVLYYRLWQAKDMKKKGRKQVFTKEFKLAPGPLLHKEIIHLPHHVYFAFHDPILGFNPEDINTFR